MFLFVIDNFIFRFLDFDLEIDVLTLKMTLNIIKYDIIICYKSHFRILNNTRIYQKWITQLKLHERCITLV